MCMFSKNTGPNLRYKSFWFIYIYIIIYMLQNA